jgi:hypothetical protein
MDGLAIRHSLINSAVCKLDNTGDNNASCLVAGVVTLMKDYVICEKGQAAFTRTSTNSCELF